MLLLPQQLVQDEKRKEGALAAFRRETVAAQQVAPNLKPFPGADVGNVPGRGKAAVEKVLDDPLEFG